MHNQRHNVQLDDIMASFPDDDTDKIIPNKRYYRRATISSGVRQEKGKIMRRSSSCDSGILRNFRSTISESSHQNQRSRHVSWGTPNILNPGLPRTQTLQNNNDWGAEERGSAKVRRPDSPYQQSAANPQDEDSTMQRPQQQQHNTITAVTNLPWTYKRFNISGQYTGFINSSSEPHGEGTFVADEDDSKITCTWNNGKIIVDSMVTERVCGKVNNIDIVEKKKKERKRSGLSKSLPINMENEVLPAPLSPTPSIPATGSPTSLPDYHLGNTTRHRSHMIIPPNSQVAITNVDTLQSLDFCFVKRSNGDWTYSIVADRPDVNCVRCVLDGNGSTKTIRQKYWERGIRLVNTDVLADWGGENNRESLAAEQGNHKENESQPRAATNRDRKKKKNHRHRSHEPSRRRRRSVESRASSKRSTSHQPSVSSRHEGDIYVGPGVITTGSSFMPKKDEHPCYQQKIRGQTLPPKEMHINRRKSTGDFNVSEQAVITAEERSLLDKREDRVAWTANNRKRMLKKLGSPNRRMTTGDIDLDLSFISKEAVILPVRIQEEVNFGKDESTTQQFCYYENTMGSSFDALKSSPSKLSLLSKDAVILPVKVQDAVNGGSKDEGSAPSAAAVDAFGSSTNAVIHVEQTFDDLPSRTDKQLRKSSPSRSSYHQEDASFDGRYGRFPQQRRIRTSQSCSPLPNRKVIPLSILKENTFTANEASDDRPNTDNFASVLSMLHGDVNYKRRENNSNSGSLGGVANLPSYLPKNKMGRRRSSHNSITTLERPGRLGRRKSSNDSLAGRRRSSQSSVTSIEGLSELFRELYTPEYLARCGSKKMGRSSSSQSIATTLANEEAMFELLDIDD